jgi:hypothetical protein
MTVARKPGHRGEHEISRNPLRREGRIASAEPVCSCACFCALLHARPRVQRAPGLPCALLLLSRAAIDAKLGRIAPRECGRTSSRCMTIELEIHTHVVPDKRLVRRSSQSEGGSETHQLQSRRRWVSLKAQPILRTIFQLARMKRSEIRDHNRRHRAPGLRCASSGLQPYELRAARFWRQPWPECGVTGRITPTGVVGGFVKPKLPNPL